MRNTDKCSIAEGATRVDKKPLSTQLKTFAKNTISKMLTSGADKVTLEEFIPPPDSALELRRALKVKIRDLESELNKVHRVKKGASVWQHLNLRRLGRSLQLRRQLHRARKDGEFAREMAMLPLSLKNPDLGGNNPEPNSPRRADRRTREYELQTKSAYDSELLIPGLKDFGKNVAENIVLTRQATGPERMIRWDIPPLDEAKKQLEQAKIDMEIAAEQAKKHPRRHFNEHVQDWLIKLGLGKDNAYKHPTINYGPKYKAQLKSAVLERFRLPSEKE